MTRLAFLLAATLLAGCAAGKTDLPLSTASQLGRDQVSPVDATYKLGVGDQISLTVYGEADLTHNYAINPNGTIEVPLIGSVKASGLTIDQLTSQIRTRLSDGYLREPNVTGTIVTYRPFYILGEVNKPGQYAYQSGMTLSSAVALAGGYTYRAQRGFVFIRPETGGGETRVEAAPELAVRPGDTIRVTERFF
jgi:polysaccharide export outer membrane protein